MNWNRWIRQTHRWLSIAFTFGFIVNAVLAVGGHAVYWAYFLAIVPLFLLLFSGLYLFSLPYVAKWRIGQGARA